ncbi:hypothetical protein B0H16DRAFT_1797933 [Mycena metata]|uniref:Uncharacterized protein n=1 Tax=Mycena metata TaxID=1033252 RepID=A0AAD7HE16_9AGAR|nr:hypothetical protein B0H16DRAFT_1797933 [Mycena metata]
MEKVVFSVLATPKLYQGCLEKLGLVIAPNLTITHWPGPPSAAADHEVVCRRLAECGSQARTGSAALAREEYEQAVETQEAFPAPPSLNKDEVEVFARSPVLPWQDRMVDYCKPICRPPHSKVALAIESNHVRPSRFTGLLWKHHPWHKELHALGAKVGQDPTFSLVEWLKHHMPGAPSNRDEVRVPLDDDANMPFVPGPTTTTSTTVNPAAIALTTPTTPPIASEPTSFHVTPPADFATTQLGHEEPTPSTSQESLMDVAMAVGFSFTTNSLAASEYAPTKEDLLAGPPAQIDWAQYEGILRVGDVPSGDVYTEFLNNVPVTEDNADADDLGE